MALELERKFLVHREKLPPLTAGRCITQGYLCESPEVRFRIIENAAAITIKKILGPGKRLEFEFPPEPMNPQDLEDLKSLALYPPLVKTRYEIIHAGLRWEIDVYANKNAGLISAEVEIDDENATIDFPDWIDQNREITNDGRYANINLTRTPYSAQPSD